MNPKINNSGNVFDNTINYEHSISEAKKLIDYHFTDDEVKNKRVLDAGCRLGYNSKVFAIKESNSVIGVDLSKKCIKAAKNKFNNFKNMEFFVGDIRNLNQFKTSSFDIVFCFGTIVYLDDKGMEKAFKEFIRIVKPHGTILISFQKDKNLIVKFFTLLANLVNLRIYLKLIDALSLLLIPFSRILLGRGVSRDFLKYDILLSLRNLHYGVNIDIPSKYKVATAETEFSSAKTTVVYKIKIPNNKKL